jgi:hypothetical protein
MNISSSKLENACKFLLQKTASFELKNKTLKHGKINLFAQRNFYLIFYLVTNKKEKIEIPIPYDIEIHEDDNLVYFDYRIKTLSKYTPNAEHLLKLYASPASRNNKFWDTILTINANFYEK